MSTEDRDKRVICVLISAFIAPERSIVIEVGKAASIFPFLLCNCGSDFAEGPFLLTVAAQLIDHVPKGSVWPSPKTPFRHGQQFSFWKNGHVGAASDPRKVVARCHSYRMVIPGLPHNENRCAKANHLDLSGAVSYTPGQAATRSYALNDFGIPLNERRHT